MIILSSSPRPALEGLRVDGRSMVRVALLAETTAVLSGAGLRLGSAAAADGLPVPVDTPPLALPTLPPASMPTPSAPLPVPTDAPTLVPPTPSTARTDPDRDALSTGAHSSTDPETADLTASTHVEGRGRSSGYTDNQGDCHVSVHCGIPPAA